MGSMWNTRRQVANGTLQKNFYPNPARFSALFTTVVVLAFAISAHAQWVAYNDSVAGTIGTQTAVNATTNGMRLAGGPYTLRNITDGTVIPNVTMTVATFGATPANGGTGGNPIAGSPLYNTFNGYVYFGANVIQITAAETNTITFSGLDPNKHYKFQAGACRGGSYSNRWISCNISGVDFATPNHQQGATSPHGIITANNEPTLMGGYQAAINTGHNLAGDMVEWDDIAPGSDGSFTISSTQWYYNGPVTSHGTYAGTFYPNATTYGNALDGFRLEELLSYSPPAVHLSPAGDQTVNQCGSVTWTATATGGNPPYIYQWYHGNDPIPDQTAATLTLNDVQPGAAGNYVVIVMDGFETLVPSQEVALTVTPANGVPAMVSAISETDRHTVTVSFSEKVKISSATGANFLVHPVDNSGNIAVASSVVSNGTNVILVTADALQNQNYQVKVQGSGVSGCAGSVPDGAFISLVQQLDLISVAGSIWRYNDAGVDLGAVWLANAYDDTAAGWLSGLSPLDGKSPQPPGRTNVGGFIVGTQLALTNANFPNPMAVIPSYYFKHHFTLNVMPANVTLQLRTFFDDYGIVYLNGQEAYRDTNLVATNELFSFYAGGTVVGTAALSDYKPFPATNLVSGENVVAVYLKQGTPGSSDITMGLELIAAVSDFTELSAPLSVSISPGDGTVAQCDTFTYHALPSGGTGPYFYQWYKNNLQSPIGDATNISLTLTNVQPGVDDGGYFVVVADSSPITQVQPSPTSVLTVMPNALFSAVGDSNLYQVTLSFRQPIAISSPAGADFLIQCVQDGSVLPLASAVVTNQTNVILTTSAPCLSQNYQVTIQGNGVLNTCSGTALSGSIMLQHQITLLGFNASALWRYNQEGVDLDTAWKEYSYPDESGWPQGPAVFDAKIGGRTTIAGLPVGTVLQLTNAAFAAGTNDLPTYYFRTHFTWPPNVSPANATVTMRTLLDEGAIVYVNGREVWRSSTITAANESFISYLGDAIAEAAISEPIPLSPTNFIDGDNVIAVFLKQGSASSSDITMGLELVASAAILDKDFSLTLATNGYGAIICNPDQPTYRLAATVNLLATNDPAHPDYDFLNWSGGATGNQNPLTVIMDTNHFITANFVSTILYASVQGLGSIAKIPDKPYYRVGDPVLLTAQPACWWYAFSGWSDGLTANPRTVTIGAENSYTAIFSSTTPLETNIVNGVSRVGPVGMPMLLVGTSVVLATPYTNRGPAQISLLSTFADANILYSLDGSDPLAFPKLYDSAFSIRKSCRLRAVALCSDFTDPVEIEPIDLVILPALSATTLGGGIVSIEPPDGPYLSDGTAIISSSPLPGWNFLGWLGDATGTDPAASIAMTRNKCVEAVFGTSLTTNVAVGSGTILVDPPAGPYLYGSRVRLTALPQPGFCFSSWAGAAAGTNNPVILSMTNPNPAIRAVFVVGQNSLTVIPTGYGRVLTAPCLNRYSYPQNVTNTAIPGPNQNFLNWGGDISGAQILNVTNLIVSTDSSRVITANFTARPQLWIPYCCAEQNTDVYQFRVYGNVGDLYQIQTSTNLADWTPVGTVTNNIGVISFTDLSSPDTPQRLYRALLP